MRRLLIQTCIGVVMGAAAGWVHAQASSAPRLATKDEYRACKVANQVLEARKRRLDAMVERHNQASATHQADSSRYLTERQRAGLTTPAAIAAYNEAVSRLNARTMALMGMQRELVKEQEGFNAEVMRVNAQCGGQIVDQDVADEVDEEFRTAPKR